MKATNLIFIDIDGVLNNSNFYKITPFYTWNLLDPKSVKLLNQLIRENNAILVISSHWRKTYGLKKVKQVFKKNKIKAPLIEAISPKSSTKEKGITNFVKRIKSTLKNVNYVVFDDEPLQIENLIQTNPEWGLDYLSYKKATDIFKNFEKQLNKKEND